MAARVPYGAHQTHRRYSATSCIGWRNVSNRQGGQAVLGLAMMRAPNSDERLFLVPQWEILQT